MRKIMKAKFFLFFPLLFLGCQLPAYAQNIPQGEMFAGFSYARLNELVPRQSGLDAFGVNFQGTYNFNEVLGATADFGAHYDSGSNLYTFMAGPRVHLRGERITPFAHVLVGVARASRVPIDVRNGNVLRFGGDSGLCVATGGGLDVRVNDLVSIRVIQGEFMFTRIGGAGKLLRDTQGHLRMGFGVNFTFGRK